MAQMIKRISKFALLVFFISMFTPIVAPEVLEQSEAVANKSTICHRTKSVKNPYRMITVSQGAVAGGHSGHEGGLWTTSSVQGDIWGDIIPDEASGGPNNKEKNWTTAGIAIYRGQTLNPATGSAVCKVMSFKQYRDSEIAAAGGTFTAAQEAAFLADIKDAKADEDLTLLNSLGLTFNTLTATNFNALASASEAIVVTTKVATLVTTTSATLHGSVKTDTTALNCKFEYDDNSSLVSPNTVPAAAVPATLNNTLQIEEAITGLTPGTKYFYRLFCQQSGDAYLYGETFFFTAGTAYSVTYDSNTATSGDVPSDSSLYAASESAVVRGNAGVLVKTGSTFAGWTLNADGTGTVYSPSHTTTLVMSSNRVFYAKWSVETYTVAFNGNTNTGGAVPSSQTKTYNVSFTLSGNTGSLAKTGHSFAGWNTASGGGGTSYAAGAPYTTNAAATLFAQWTPDTYTVTYNGNGNLGGAVPADQTKTYSVSLTLRTNSGTLTKGTDTFSGWNTAAGGTGTNYAEGASYTVNAGTTLYAKWTSASDWSVNYLGNGNDGGSAPASQTVTRGSALNLQTNSGNLSLTGYSFTGWATQADGGGVSYLVSQLETPTANMNLYAKWTIDTYTVTYNGNANTSGVVPGNQTKTFNVSLTLSVNSGSPVLAKTGHTFGGWNTASGGGGTSYAAGAAYTTNAAATLYAQWTPDTYTVTYSGNGSTGGSIPADQTKTYDASLTLQTNSGTLTKGTDTFSGWNTAADGSGTNYAAGASYTANAGTTLYAKWTAAAGGGSGGGGSGGGGSSGGGNATSAAAQSKPTPAVVRKSAALVTVGTTPVKSNVVTTPVTPSVATPAPGNSGNTPSAAGTTGGTTTAPGSSGNTPSTGGTTPTTPAPGNTPVAGGTEERINVNNTRLSQTTAISAQAVQAVTFKGAGITQVNVVNNEVAVQARPGFSGKTTVAITVTSAEEVSTITAEVIVIPLPVTNPVVRVVSEDRARIQWIRSPNAVTYEVTQGGRLLCTTARSICTVTEGISATEPVQIKALGRDQTESTAKQATYVEAPSVRVVPDVALVVNFDTAKFNLDNQDRRLIRAFAADVERFGFKEVDISGHTDSRGGIDNNVLSNNRAKAARAYLLTLLPNLKVTINGFADAINVAPNTTVQGLAANRRAEFRVVG